MGIADSNPRGVGHSQVKDFAGAFEVFRLIGALCRRPRIGDRPRELLDRAERWGETYRRPERAGRRGLPMLCLVHSQRHEGLLRAVADQLAHTQPNVVNHAYLDCTAESAHSDPAQSGSVAGDALSPAVGTADQVRCLLRRTRDALAQPTKVRGRGLRFRLFEEIDWIMGLDLDADDPESAIGTDPCEAGVSNSPPRNRDKDALLRKLLQHHGLQQRVAAGLGKAVELPDPVPKWWKLLLMVLQAVSLISFRWVVTGRVPLISGRYRWFMRQPDMAPLQLSETFVRFARRLTVDGLRRSDGEWNEDPDWVATLVVNAFLEDLRRDYRLRWWKVWQRRRMTYPVLLLDNVTSTNGGFAVLKLVNEVRNNTGLFDPLLVISAGPDTPPDAGSRYHGRPEEGAARAVEAYRRWQSVLLDDRRRRRDLTWYLPLRVPDPESDVKALTFSGYRFTGRQARPVWWQLRGTRIGVVVALVAVCVAAEVMVSNAHDERLRAQCGTTITSLQLIGDECIGDFAGFGGDLFQAPRNGIDRSPAERNLRAVEERIAQQNTEAEARHRSEPKRPYLTIAVLQAMTSDAGATALTSEREALEGVAVAQNRQLDLHGDADPVLRVLIASAGRRMRYGEQVAGILARQAAADPSIVGVVGLDMSTEYTQRTIMALTNAGLPMVAATLSANQFADALSPMYYQVAPQDRREAAVAAAFAGADPMFAGKSRRVRIYYSTDPTDLYSGDLREQARVMFKQQGFAVDSPIGFTPDGMTGAPQAVAAGDVVGDATAAGRDTCSFDGVAFFAGRGVPDFGEFLSGASGCGSKAVIIGDDDTTRHVVDETSRTHATGLGYYHVSFASVPSTMPGSVDIPSETWNFVFNNGGLRALFPFETTEQDRGLDEHAALAYDATEVFVHAAQLTRAGGYAPPLSPGTVWREITAIHNPRRDGTQIDNAFEGVTGTIDFGGNIGSRVPKDKLVAIFHVDEKGHIDHGFQRLCGAIHNRDAEKWCPVDPPQ